MERYRRRSRDFKNQVNSDAGSPGVGSNVVGTDNDLFGDFPIPAAYSPPCFPRRTKRSGSYAYGEGGLLYNRRFNVGVYDAVGSASAVNGSADASDTNAEIYRQQRRRHSEAVGSSAVYRGSADPSDASTDASTDASAYMFRQQRRMHSHAVGSDSAVYGSADAGADTYRQQRRRHSEAVGSSVVYGSADASADIYRQQRRRHSHFHDSYGRPTSSNKFYLKG